MTREAASTSAARPVAAGPVAQMTMMPSRRAIPTAALA